MKHGARNDIPATVTAIKRGDIMAQVDVQLVGTEHRMSSVMTLDSLEELGLREGDTVHVLAKAVNVLLVRPNEAPPPGEDPAVDGMRGM